MIFLLIMQKYFINISFTLL